MPTVIAIDPVTRLEGHLRVEVTVETVSGQPQVVSSRVSGTSFRGFEQMLVNRDPREAPQLTQRICGVCPVPHGVAAAMALEQASGQTVSENARLLRNLVMGANFIQSHLLHFYHLSLLDYVSGPAAPPWLPEWDVDRRVNAAGTARLNASYLAALRMVRQAQEMGAVFAGRLPHSPACVPGGFTTVPTKEQITRFRAYATALAGFIRDTYLPDVDFLTAQYPEYSQWGRGPANFLAFGAFDLDAAGGKKLFAPGRAINGGKAIEPLKPEAIAEQVANSWYAGEPAGRPPADGITQPVYPKEGAYSWIKAVRYDSQACETGPLARMWIGGLWQNGISANDRHLARAQEALHLVNAMPAWLGELKAGQTAYTDYALPAEATGAGLTEAPRGALGHWLGIAGRKIARYQVVTPTCWNASPRDDAQKPGPLEAALVGIPVRDTERPIEVLRVIHSFDPCLACAVHVSRPAPGARIRIFGERPR